MARVGDAGGHATVTLMNLSGQRSGRMQRESGGTDSRQRVLARAPAQEPPKRLKPRDVFPAGPKAGEGQDEEGEGEADGEEGEGDEQEHPSTNMPCTPRLTCHAPLD